MAGTGMIGAALSSIGALLLIVALIAGLGTLLRRIDPSLRRRLIAPAARGGTVLATRRLDRRRSLSLIDFEGERYVLLSGGPNDIMLKSRTIDERGRP